MATRTRLALTLFAALLAASPAAAQWLMVVRNESPDFHGVMLVDAADGSLVEPEWIDETGDFLFSHAAIQVGTQVWVSEVGCDCVRRYDLDFAATPPEPTFLDTIGAGVLSNPHGMALANSRVYVSGDSIQGIVALDPDGNLLDQAEAFNFDVQVQDLEVWQQGLLASDSEAGDIRSYDFDLNFLGLFHDTMPGAGIGTPMQIKRRLPLFNVYGAGFNEGLFEYNGEGQQINDYALGGFRGLHPLAGGTVLVGVGGLSVFDPSTFDLTQVANVGPAQIEPLDVFAPGCGNGLLEAGEGCDDGNTLDGDGCGADCQPGALCGNGIVEPGEECDDGNLIDGDGCDQDCTTNFVCGNGILEPGEECDDGNPLNGDGCSAGCTIESVCGNGVIEPGEQCDDGNAEPGDGCDGGCAVEAVCGNGVIEPGEACDDGNTEPGDGCSGACGVEPVNPGPCPANEQAELVSPAPETAGVFGMTVAVDGDRIIVGSAGADLGGLEDAGAAWVFAFDGSSWNLEAELRAGDPETLANFGDALATDGDVAVVGAVLADSAFADDIGAAYVFRRGAGGNWTQEAKLTLDEADSQDQESLLIPSVTKGLAISGDTVLVGGRFFSPGGIFGGFFGAGGAWVFRDAGGGDWVQERKLLAPDMAANDAFGVAVALEGDLALIGADRAHAGADDSGAAYVFRRQGGSWTQEVKLAPASLTDNASFGTDVAMSGDTLVVGSPGWSPIDGFPGPGAAFVFRRLGEAWLHEATITPSTATVGVNFGWAVDIDGDVIVVGAEMDDEVAGNAGAAYVFRRFGSAWVESAKLLASDGAVADRLGRFVSVDGGRTVVGAQFHDVAAASDGAAYVFDLAITDCNANGAPDDCDIAGGASADADRDGVPDECQADPCPWDLDADGAVGTTDLLALLAAWNTDPAGPPDFDGDGTVGTPDFLELLANWGACPST